MKRRLSCIFFFLLISLFSCRKEVALVDQGGYPHDVGLIMLNSCAVAGCHNSASYKAASSLNLETWTNMFNGSSSGSPVIPYNSTFSSLCYFINTYPDLGLRNLPTMPFNGTPLSHSQVKLIKDWIDKGAPDRNGKVMWADNPLRKKFYAVNQGCDVVTVFDAATQLPMRYINVGTKPGIESPHQIRVSLDGNYWYVTFVNNNIMQKFRCSDDSFVGNIPLTPLANGSGTQDDIAWNTFVISKNGKRAYCTSLNASGRVCAVDLENMKLVAYSGLLANPHGIVLSPEEDRVYVGSQYDNYVMMLDTSFQDSKKIFLDNTASPNGLVQPHDLILTSDGTGILITCQQSNDVRVLDLASSSISAIIPTGIFPQDIVYSPSLRQFFVSCTEDYTTFPGQSGVITRIRESDYVVTNIPCGYEPHGLAIDEDKRLLYVLSRNISTNGPLPHHTSECEGRNGFVDFVDLNTFTVLPRRYELSVDPYYISARP